MDWKKAEKEFIPMLAYSGVQYKAGFPKNFYHILVDSKDTVNLFKEVFHPTRVSRDGNLIQLFEDDYNFTILTQLENTVKNFHDLMITVFKFKNDSKRKIMIITRQKSVLKLLSETLERQSIKYLGTEKFLNSKTDE